MSDGAKKSYGRYVSPLLAAVVVRSITLEKAVEPQPKPNPKDAADSKQAQALADDQPFPILKGPLAPKKEQELVKVCVCVVVYRSFDRSIYRSMGIYISPPLSLLSLTHGFGSVLCCAVLCCAVLCCAITTRSCAVCRGLDRGLDRG